MLPGPVGAARLRFGNAQRDVDEAREAREGSRSSTRLPSAAQDPLAGAELCRTTGFVRTEHATDCFSGLPDWRDAVPESPLGRATAQLPYQRRQRGGAMHRTPNSENAGWGTKTQASTRKRKGNPCTDRGRRGPSPLHASLNLPFSFPLCMPLLGYSDVTCPVLYESHIAKFTHFWRRKKSRCRRTRAIF